MCSFAMMPEVKGEADDEDGRERFMSKRKTKNEADGQHQAWDMNECGLEEGDSPDRRRWKRMVLAQNQNWHPSWTRERRCQKWNTDKPHLVRCLLPPEEPFYPMGYLLPVRDHPALYQPPCSIWTQEYPAIIPGGDKLKCCIRYKLIRPVWLEWARLNFGWLDWLCYPLGGMLICVSGKPSLSCLLGLDCTVHGQPH